MPSVFFGLFTRWICENSPLGLGNSPSGTCGFMFVCLCVCVLVGWEGLWSGALKKKTTQNKNSCPQSILHACDSRAAFAGSN